MINLLEQNKKEADEAVGVYRNIGNTYSMPSIHSAIQDRQYILAENESVLEILKIHGDLRTQLPIKARIANINEQIEYLKSKL